MIGPESEMRTSYVLDSCIAARLAKKTSGLVVALEHRYYG